MKTYLIIFLSIFLFALTGCEQKTLQSEVKLNQFYSEKNNTAVAICRIAPGEYLLKMDITYPEDKAKIDFGIECTDPEMKFTPVVEQYDINGIDSLELTVKVSKEANYKVFIRFIESNILHTEPYIKIVKGDVETLEMTNAPEIQLEYISDDEKEKTYEWLYGEITVPQDKNPPFTSFFPLNYKEAKLGLSKEPDGKSEIMFLATGADHNQSAMNLTGKGEKIKTDNYENKGKRIYTAHYTYDWEANIPIQFLMNRKILDNKKVLLSAWFKDQSRNDWKFLASWKVNETVDAKQIYSYIKNYDKQTGSSSRQAEIGNIWGKEAGKEWEELIKAKFSVIDNNNREDYQAGVTEGKPQKFYLASGGYGKTGSPNEPISIQKTNKAPSIDFESMDAEIQYFAKKNNANWGYIPDTKVEIISGSASEYEKNSNEKIEKSFDGNFSTLYHSRWKGTEFPVTLTYNFDGKDTIDYVIYYPRTDGTNGNFSEFELWTQSSGQHNYQKVGNYNFKGSTTSSLIALPTPLRNAQSIQFVVKSGLGDPGTNGFVSCAEMEFYKKNGSTTIPDVFTDATCSKLKPSVQKENIENIAAEEYRELAKALYSNNYPSLYRIKEYKPYPHPEMMATKNKTSTYGLMDNPTGIFIEPDEDIVIFVGQTKSQKISLRSVNFDNSYSCTDYLLKEGLNVIRAKDKGLLYIMYHTDDPKAQPIKIHIASGSINGYYDITQHTNSDWKNMLDSTICDYMDVVGKYAHLTYAVSDFKKFTPDIERLIQVYDSIVWLEEKFIGLEKYNRMNKNRMYFYLDPNTPYGGYATYTRTGYCRGFMSGICNPDRLRSSDIWGPAHEVGHVNQTRPGFKWVGMTEVSNNIYSLYVQQQFGNPTRLTTEKLHSDFDGTWNNRYEKGFTEIIGKGISHMEHSDVFCKLIPFWQLQLYNAEITGYKDFYADVHQQIRIKPDPKTDSEAQLQFIKICCDAAKTDFTDFFIQWGMLKVMDGNISDLSSIPNKIYGSKDFTISQQEIDDLKKYASKYKKPASNMHYLCDNTISLFKNKRKIKEGKIERIGNKIALSDWENAVVYEIYDGDQLLLITPFATFDLPEGSTNPEIHAIPAEGDPVIKKI